MPAPTSTRPGTSATRAPLVPISDTATASTGPGTGATGAPRVPFPDPPPGRTTRPGVSAPPPAATPLRPGRAVRAGAGPEVTTYATARIVKTRPASSGPRPRPIWR